LSANLVALHRRVGVAVANAETIRHAADSVRPLSVHRL
jgi:hypothetical protein